MKKALLSIVLTLRLFAGGTHADADEGLWTIDHFPAAQVKTLYGVNISKDWLAHVMKSAVRLNACSASLVSPTGLVLTNNHCVAQCTQDISGTVRDAYTNGYLAESKQTERRCVTFSAEVLDSIADVTSRVTRVSSGLQGASLLKAQTATMAAIEKQACSGEPYVRCQVTEFFSGSQFKLFKYRRYTDVRLVFSPGASVATLPSNTFPPVKFDVAFLRIYQDGKPACTPSYLHWDSSAPHTGELVFLAGSPRASDRRLTASQLVTERDTEVPEWLTQASGLISRLEQFEQKSTENRSVSEYLVWDLTNRHDYDAILEAALTQGSLITEKLQEEQQLSSKAGPVVQQAFSVIARAEQARRDQMLVHRYLSEGPSMDNSLSELFRYARLLVRGTMNGANPSSNRPSTYSDSQRALQEQQLFDGRKVYVPLEQLQLRFWFDSIEQNLKADDPTRQVLLGDQTAEGLALQLSQSALGDNALRRQLWEGGAAAVHASNDPMVRYVLSIESATQASKAKWENTVIGPETQAAKVVAKARFRIYGESFYPDANRTLRLNYGVIAGYDFDGKKFGATSTFSDLFKETKGPTDMKLDKRWLAAEDKLNPNTILNLSTTNDGINGNSGSPLLNARGEVIGVFWGGNDFAMVGDYGYDPKLNRATAVSAAGITEVLMKIYGANDLVQELFTGSGHQ